MRKIPGIKYAVTIIIAMAFFPLAYCDSQTANLLNLTTPQTTNPLTKQGAAEESRMIKQNQLNTCYSVKVTTTIQKRYDRNQDGYLTGIELQKYLKQYSK